MTSALSADKRALLEKLYYSIRSPASFTGSDALYLAAKKSSPDLTKNQVRKFLGEQATYLIHRRIRKPRGKSHRFGKYVLTAPYLDLACDTAVFGHSKLPHVLVCRDPFSGYVYARPQRGLKSQTTLKNYKKLIEEQAGGVHFPVVYTDLGKEFASFHTLPGKHVTTHGRNQKSYPAEQTIKQIRAKLERYSTHLGRKVDVSRVLPDILSSINNTPILRTGLTPKESQLPKNAGLVFTKKYLPYLKAKERNRDRARFRIDDLVRISLPHGSNTFAKKSLPGFSTETFRVSDIRGTLPQTYFVRDSQDRRIDSYFYEQELMKNGRKPDIR